MNPKSIPFRDWHLFKLLNEYETTTLPLDLLCNQYFRTHKAIGSKDKKCISDTLYDLIRHRSLIDRHSIKPHNWENRLATYRSMNLQEAMNDQATPPHIRVSFPKEFYHTIVDTLGEEQAMKFCLASNTKAPSTIRINPMKTTRDELISSWNGLFDVQATAHSPYGITFNKRVNYFQLPEFKEGLFEAQDEASQLLADLVNAKPGDQVLDFCSGSGGKTLAFAHKLAGKGQIYLHDIRPRILQEAKKRLNRAGIQNFQILLPDDPKFNSLKKTMDWVLVDAPCSGTGTLRRNPEMKWKFNLEKIKEFVELQREIFNTAIQFLKPGCKIVYATCSILKEENQNQVEFFLKHYPLKLVDTPFSTIPTLGGMDGFFAAVFSLQETV